MQKLKFLVDGKEDSAGHINEVIGLDAITIHSAGRIFFVSAQLNKYKDAQSKLDGKNTSVDKVRVEKLFASDLGLSGVEFHNMIIDALAKKHKMNTIEVEADLMMKSPAEVKLEKEKDKVESDKATSANDENEIN